MGIDPDATFLERKAGRINEEAISLVDGMTDMTEAQFDAMAADVLGRWQANQQARIEKEIARSPMQVYKPDEVAKMLKVEKETIRRWLASGYLPGAKLGGKEWRVMEEDLVAFMRRERDKACEGVGNANASEPDHSVP